MWNASQPTTPLNLPLGLIIIKCKYTCFVFIFLLCDEKIMITTCNYKNIVKILVLCLLYILWWKTVYLCNIHPKNFFLVWAFMSKVWIFTPLKFFELPLKFWKNGWWCNHREGFECKKQKHFVKKRKSQLLADMG